MLGLDPLGRAFAADVRLLEAWSRLQFARLLPRTRSVVSKSLTFVSYSKRLRKAFPIYKALSPLDFLERLQEVGLSFSCGCLEYFEGSRIRHHVLS